MLGYLFAELSRVHQRSNLQTSPLSWNYGDLPKKKKNKKKKKKKKKHRLKPSGREGPLDPKGSGPFEASKRPLRSQDTLGEGGRVGGDGGRAGGEGRGGNEP